MNLVEYVKKIEKMNDEELGYEAIKQANIMSDARQSITFLVNEKKRRSKK